MEMAPLNHQFLSLALCLLPLLTISALSAVANESSLIYPLNCSDRVQTCSSYLYHISRGLRVQQIASYYSVNAPDVKPVVYRSKKDYLVSVLCTCKDVNGTRGYFYDTLYKVQSGDTFVGITSKIYNGQAWRVGGEESIIAGEAITIHLVCGCLEVKSREVVTYTVQKDDTLSNIANTFSANLSEIASLDERLTQNPSFIDIGWVLFVPVENIEFLAPQKGKIRKWVIIVCITSAVILFGLSALILVLLIRRKRRCKKKDSQTVSKTGSAANVSSMHQSPRRDIEDATTFESERPVIYSVEEVDKATNNFDESRKIGEGGYGSVYYGILGEQEVAIKKMKDSMAKEFLAELKVLCRIHHINVVELLGYASGDGHLYLVYEYVQKGSLNDHLHDPLLKGHQPLTWTARARIALDTARGIEYIHDHTKARYVHRDIKSSNILLDQGLSAKVADFGLARLVERSIEEEDCIATCLVGTPGYIPPESVRELQMSSKTDVYAFGVVLAELVTGQKALARDNQKPHRLKTLASFMYSLFEDDSEVALEAHIDSNMEANYPIEEVYKMAETSWRCLNEDAVNRPEMQEIVQALSKIMTSSIEWEASLGGNSQVFSRLMIGR